MITTLFVILILQVVYVSLVTIRTILTIKGYRYRAAILSSFDILTYVIGFKIVLDNLDKPINLMVYCISYGIGILVGIKIEEVLALGFLTLQVIIDITDQTTVSELRKKGYGVTVSKAEGLEGPRLILLIISTRKQQKSLIAYIKQLNPEAFLFSYEPRLYHGGYILGNLNKRIS